jgi:hypothetical protein
MGPRRISILGISLNCHPDAMSRSTPQRRSRAVQHNDGISGLDGGQYQAGGLLSW